MEIDDIVIRVRVVAEDAKYIIQTLTNSFQKLEDMKSGLSNNLPQPNIEGFASQYASVMAMKTELSEGIVIPIAASEDPAASLMSFDTAAFAQEQTAPLMATSSTMATTQQESVKPGIIASSSSQIVSTDKLIKERESYYTKLISLIKSKEADITAELKSSYDRQLGDLKASFENELNSYEIRIKQIDELLKSNDRNDEDAEYKDKMLRLAELLKYENDDGNRYELQKEMANLTSNYESRKEKEALYDERSQLTELSAAARTAYNDQKAAMQETLEAELSGIRLSYEQQLEALGAKMENELTLLKANQEEKTNLNTNEQSLFALFLNSKLNLQRDYTAKEYLLLSNAQHTILAMLYAQIAAFAAAGATVGSAFASAFEGQMYSVQARIDSLRAQLAALGAEESQQASTYNFNQTISSTVASPSQIARETRSLLENAVYYS